MPACLPIPSLEESLTRATGWRKRPLSWEARAALWPSSACQPPSPVPAAHQCSRPGLRGALPPQGRERPLAGATADLRGRRPAFLAFRPRPGNSWEKPADPAASARPRAACSGERLGGGRPKPVPPGGLPACLESRTPDGKPPGRSGMRPWRQPSGKAGAHAEDGAGPEAAFPELKPLAGRRPRVLPSLGVRGKGGRADSRDGLGSLSVGRTPLPRPSGNRPGGRPSGRTGGLLRVLLIPLKGALGRRRERPFPRPPRLSRPLPAPRLAPRASPPKGAPLPTPAGRSASSAPQPRPDPPAGPASPAAMGSRRPQP